ncbi:MAG TPA: aspartyl-phosphate phosphatase Spo0E family protein [Clostridiales bacterium]|nr:aspartyl-phosphate phosphatase Spo0E family protein [Clostridiales bacterium]
MQYGEKVTQLKEEIMMLQKKLGDSINDEKINSGNLLKISKELDALIVDYYNAKSDSEL